jgi:hypothetical protein
VAIIAVGLFYPRRTPKKLNTIGLKGVCSPELWSLMNMFFVQRDIEGGAFSIFRGLTIGFDNPSS